MKKILSSLIVALFAAAGYAGESTISVTGAGQVAVKPAFVAVQFSIQTRDKKQEPAQNRNLEISGAVLKLLKSRHGIKQDDIYTLDYQLNEDYEMINEKQVFVGYVARTGMKVNIRNMEKYRAVISDLLKAGATNIDSLGFGYEKTGLLKIDALGLAYADARSKAEKVASLAGKTLAGSVKIEEIETDFGPLRAEMRMKAEASGDVISSGQQFVTAKIHVVFEMK